MDGFGLGVKNDSGFGSDRLSILMPNQRSKRGSKLDDCTFPERDDATEQPGNLLLLHGKQRHVRHVAKQLVELSLSISRPIITRLANLDAHHALKLAVENVENDGFQSKSCANQLKALADPLRLKIIDLLRHGEMAVGDISEFLEVEIATVSHHLKILKKAHFVECKRDGRHIIYALTPDLLQKPRGSTKQFLNLGCCRIEIPDNKPGHEG